LGGSDFEVALTALARRIRLTPPKNQFIARGSELGLSRGLLARVVLKKTVTWTYRAVGWAGLRGSGAQKKKPALGRQGGN